MSILVRFVRADEGKAVFVNPAHVADVEERPNWNGEPACQINMVNGDRWVMKGTAAEAAARIEGGL